MMAGCLFCERNGQLEDSGIAAVATDPDCRVSVRVVGACLSPEDTGRLRPQTAGGRKTGGASAHRKHVLLLPFFCWVIKFHSEATKLQKPAYYVQ